MRCAGPYGDAAGERLARQSGADRGAGNSPVRPNFAGRGRSGLGCHFGRAKWRGDVGCGRNKDDCRMDGHPPERRRRIASGAPAARRGGCSWHRRRSGPAFGSGQQINLRQGRIWCVQGPQSGQGGHSAGRQVWRFGQSSGPRVSLGPSARDRADPRRCRTAARKFHRRRLCHLLRHRLSGHPTDGPDGDASGRTAP
jgi:hypothetical protein